MQIFKEEYTGDGNNDEEIKGKLNSNNEKKMDQWFQSEQVDGDLIFVCNLCDNVKEHLMADHEDQMNTFGSEYSNSEINKNVRKNVYRSKLLLVCIQ